MMDAAELGLLQDAIEAEMLRLLHAAGPLTYSDEGFASIRGLTQAIWDQIAPEDKDELRRHADEWVEQWAEDVARRILMRAL